MKALDPVVNSWLHVVKTALSAEVSSSAHSRTVRLAGRRSVKHFRSLLRLPWRAGRRATRSRRSMTTCLKVAAAPHVPASPVASLGPLRRSPLLIAAVPTFARPARRADLASSRGSRRDRRLRRRQVELALAVHARRVQLGAAPQSPSCRPPAPTLGAAPRCPISSDRLHWSRPRVAAGIQVDHRRGVCDAHGHDRGQDDQSAGAQPPPPRAHRLGCRCRTRQRQRQHAAGASTASASVSSSSSRA